MRAKRRPRGERREPPQGGQVRDRVGRAGGCRRHVALRPAADERDGHLRVGHQPVPGRGHGRGGDGRERRDEQGDQERAASDGPRHRREPTDENLVRKYGNLPRRSRRPRPASPRRWPTIRGVLAARLPELGGPLHVEQASEPCPGDGEALVELAAASINPVDVATSEGRHYSGGPQLPSTAGSEGVGRLLSPLGPLATGTLVYAGRVASGTLAERFLARDGEAWALPDDADPGVAVALGIAGMAGWLPIAHRAALQPGERVLVLGATGSVGRVAVQAALLLGASLVVGAGRDAA